MPRLQDLIYRLEEGRGSRVLSRALVILGLLAVLLAYNLRGFQSFSTAEAMDAAQLARNLARGEGYTTQCIRPLSIHLLARQPTANPEDPARLNEAHPDLANPPVYPLVLAGLMKALPFDFQVLTAKRFWNANGRFSRFQPEFLISLFNQGLFLLAVGMTFLLARRLFDPTVAWISALVLIGADVYWRFAVFGLSTMLLIVVLLSLVWVLVWLEREAREPRWGRWGFFLLALLAGVLVGMGALTRYSFGWLILPVAAYIGWLGSRSRAWVGVIPVVVCLLVMAPWLVRNYQLCGHPFGTAGYAVLEDTWVYPEHNLSRSLNPNLANRTLADAVWGKFADNSRRLIQEELPSLGLAWVGCFFIVGLMVPYRNSWTARLRTFLIPSIALIAVVQALGRTQLSDDSPFFNSENLLILFGPLCIVYGVSFFLLLLDGMNLPGPQVRHLIIGLFLALACAPLLFTVLGRTRSTVSYPPYNPPYISYFGAVIPKQDLMMSDIPWAWAWYADKKSVWHTLRAFTPRDSDATASQTESQDPQHTELTEKARTIATEELEPWVNEDIPALRDEFRKRVVGVYLSPRTTHAGILSGDSGWAKLAIKAYSDPPDTPEELGFRYVAKLPTRDHILVLDYNRWRKQVR